MEILWSIIGALVAAAAIVSIVDLVRRHVGAKRTAGWIVVLIIFPLIGTVVYWSLRPSSKTDVEDTYAAQQELRRDRGRH